MARKRTAGSSILNTKIRQLIDTQSREELAAQVWSLVQRFPELQEEFRERIALSEGDVDRLVVEARRELHKVVSEPGWRNQWDKKGYTPDYSRLKHRLERLVDQGHYDAVTKLGREVISCGLRQVSDSHDEGETSRAFTDCLPVVFRAVGESTLTGPEKILFAIDAHLEDDYDTINDQTDNILEAEWSAGDWSAVADQLAGRLRQKSADSSGSFSRNYRRDRVSDWMAQSLHNAGRQEEVLAVYQHEARTTGSYERLVHFLVASKKLDEAEGWAREGLEHTREKLPGIASSLVRLLCELARKRRAWDVVAAHAAWPFFANPSAASFDELMKAARKAKCEELVRSTALKFLETGKPPYDLVATRGVKSRVKIDDHWPLPVPDYLVPDYLVPLLRFDASHSKLRPHYDVLLQMALTAKRPDDVLYWYDKLQAGSKRAGADWSRHAGHDHSVQVAAAVAATHPERALAIYQAALQAHLTHADPTSYEAAAGYLRKLRPVLKSLEREDEWKQMLADIRLQYRNRPRFMEILKRLDRT